MDEAYNGEEAVMKVTERLLKRNCVPYRLIFMDINMPIMDGYAATEEIRKHLGKERTTIIGASAYPRSEIEGRGDEAGMDNYLGKPINPDLVSNILRSTNSSP